VIVGAGARRVLRHQRDGVLDLLPQAGFEIAGDARRDLAGALARQGERALSS
jgi:hypothetical protein